jgi:hypothetical protein
VAARLDEAVELAAGVSSVCPDGAPAEAAEAASDVADDDDDGAGGAALHVV